MAQSEMIRCQQCGLEISSDDSFTREGQLLCEDCYFKSAHRVQTCDPLAVRSAKRFREVSGLKAIEALTEQQRAIYEYIKSGDKVTAVELSTALHLSHQELENQIAILRHCELVKGQKEGNKVYLVLF